MINYDQLELNYVLVVCDIKPDDKGLCFLKFSLILYNSDRKIRDKVVYLYNT